MRKYLFIESRDPFETADVSDQWELAAALARAGKDVKVFLVQNAVFAARSRAEITSLDPETGVTVLVDDVSLAERGISPAGLRADFRVAGADDLTALILEEGRKSIWT